MKFIDQISLKNKRVLFRFDYNVPLDSSGHIADDTRIRATLPTINYALDEGARVIIISHLGRPKGKVKPEASLAPVARRLSRLLQKEVPLAPDCIGEETAALVAALKPGDVILLENLRFHPEEEKNDDGFARQLAAYADVYIDDAFGNAHRAHASNVAITKFVPECGGGFLMKKELNYFQKCLEKPARPFVAIIGGSKVSGKLEALVNLIRKVDKMIIGGGMAFTFLKALGYEVGKSLVEEDLMPKAREVMQTARELGVKFYLPVDCVMAEKMSAEAETKIVPVQEMNSHWMGLDIGPATITLFTEALTNAKTIVWNGPMGVFEIDAFGRGTAAMVHSIANSYAMTIVGGGDTDVAVHKTGESDKITYISTGGGASLELLEGKTLPGIAALEACGG
ncbi:MAG TPA: phosphoglycerate kinase [Syntrophales bacterium]|jgi:phosphoglycerate kinase|nr:phosphoglycerate kinase [Syntrophales bacterium]HOU78075.1 phosphoglycerate kinase [Syntrophales bacterium]HPC32757.1 phosphoglycerate kinase [Syntrophales bacterium]HQG34694.1 phosphoglycerate kinase [Syntrophales bacterium]HQI36074.1 phosphoglycerate kinase [Syntrophales bacterium]